MGELGIASACRIADDRRQVDDLISPVERALSDLGVANIAFEQLDTQGCYGLRNIALIVDHEIQRAHAPTGTRQLLAREGPDVAGPTRHQRRRLPCGYL
jgi:hypothetical protein